MFSATAVNSQIITSLASEAASVVNHLKNVAVTGCTTCYQQRRWFNHQSQQQETSQSHQTQQQETSQSHQTQQQAAHHKELSSLRRLGLENLPNNWLESVSVFSLQPVHQQYKSKWTTSHVSSQSFFENKHGFSPSLNHRPKFQFFSSFPSSSISWKHFDGFQKTQVRSYFNLNRLQVLENAANKEPDNAKIQAFYLQSIVDGDPEYVVQRIETGKYAVNDDCRRIYHKAFMKTNAAKADEFGFKTNSRFAPGKTEISPVYVKSVEPARNLNLGYWFWKMIRVIAYGIMMMMVLANLMDSKSPIGSKTVRPEILNKDFTFDDVQGAKEAKEELKEIVEFLKNPEKFQKLGGKIPTGVLLTGKPGVGKTLLAKAVAGEAGVPFFYNAGSEFDEMFVGVGAARIRELFVEAKKSSPAIIFIDELDAVGGKRVLNEFNSYGRNTLNQLLVELDGFGTDSKVVVIGATNFPESLDSALTRPGRFDTKIEIQLPVMIEREDIFKMYLGKVTISDDVDANKLARGTTGFTGADISNLVNQAAIKAASEGMNQIHMKHFEYARDKIIMGPERKGFIMPENEKWATAVHEAGHALIALKSENAIPVYKGTILPRGNTLGHVSCLPEKDRFSMKKKDFLAESDVSMGGIVAEEMFIGKDRISTGCSSDMAHCNQIAKSMVMSYSMSEKMGIGQWKKEWMSQATMKLADSEIKRLLEESHERAKAILTEYKDEHKLLVDAFLKYETLDKKEMELVIQGKPLTNK